MSLCEALSGLHPASESTCPSPQSPVAPLQFSAAPSPAPLLSPVPLAASPRQSVAAESNDQPRASLSRSQRRALNDIVHSQQSVLITGVAGSGKSHLLRCAIDQLPTDTTYITGSTGVAALNIGGSTIHSFAGIGFCAGTKEQALRAVNHAQRKAWRRCRVLVIDEISMVSGELFDVLDFVARSVRGMPQQPFGGIQLVMCGDFLQLPPVRGRYCFESAAWVELQVKVHLLEGHFRQAADRPFCELLDKIRIGAHDASVVAALKSRDVTVATKSAAAAKAASAQGVATEAVQLRPTKKEVEEQNNVRFGRLQPHIVNVAALSPEQQLKHLKCPTAPFVRYSSHDVHPGQKRGGSSKTNGSDDVFRLVRFLDLKKGAQVMLLRNVSLPQQLINGSTGLIVGFLTTAELTELRSLYCFITSAAARSAGSSTTATSSTVIGARFGWLLKKGGFTVQQIAEGHAKIICGEGGRGGAAAESAGGSSASSAAGRIFPVAPPKFSKRFFEAMPTRWAFKESELRCKPPSPAAIHPSVPLLTISLRDIDPALCDASALISDLLSPEVGESPVHIPVPIVAFSPSCVAAMYPFVELRKNAEGNVVASRLQVPLMHAWSITVHKAQGKTIANAEIDFKRFFSFGQAYTALSRAPSLSALTLRNFSPSAVKTCSTALQFYRQTIADDAASPQVIEV